ncbi:hypothetical protein NUSPORA_02584 [Nucleospora cyclopteri]
MQNLRIEKRVNQKTKVLVENSEEKSIQEAMSSNKVKQTYASKIALLQTINVKNAKWTEKITSEKIILEGFR